MKNICIEPECQSPVHSRHLCNPHYQKHKYRGTLNDISPSTRHCLSNINSESKTGDCSICGPNSKMRLHGKQWKCYYKSRQNTRIELTYGDGKIIPRKELNSSYDHLMSSQQGVCAVCKKSEVNGKSLSIDHCHVTGEIRGLLCSKCNTGIGLLGDNVEGLQAALDYLIKEA